VRQAKWLGALAVLAGALVVGWEAWKARDAPPPVARPTDAGSASARASEGEPPLPAVQEPRARRAAEREAAAGPSAPAVAAPVHFSGRVLDLSGEPVAGASLELRENGERADDLLASGASDAEGRFQLEVAAQEVAPLRLVAWAEGFVEWSQTQPPDDAIEVRLVPAVVVAGVVREASSARALAGVSVRQGNESVVSADDGSFTLKAVPLGQSIRLQARLDGYAPALRRFRVDEGAPARLDLELERGRLLRFSVVDVETGAPLPAAEVELAAGERMELDDQARASLWVGKGTELYVRVHLAGYLPLSWSWTVEDEGELPTPRLPMARGALIEGRVLDPDHAPLANIDIWPSNDELPMGRALLGDAERGGCDLPGDGVREPWLEPSDASGRFELLVHPLALPWTVRASHPSWISASAGPLSLPRALDRASVELVLQRGATVRGRFLRNGEPWPEGVVQARIATGKETVDSARPDEGGRYELRRLPAGRLRLELRDDYPPTVRAEIELVVEAGASYERDLAWSEAVEAIRGRVTDERGRPLEGIAVHAVAREERRSVSGATGADGCYSLAVPSLRRYRVGVTEGPLRLSQDDVPAGATGIDFVLTPTVVVALKLVDASSGRPVRDLLLPGRLTWRPSAGSERYQNALTPLGRPGLTCGLDDVYEIAVPDVPVDLRIDLEDLGLLPRDVLSVSAADRSAPLVVLLDPAAEARLRFTPDDRLAEGSRLCFLLREHEVGHVRLAAEGEQGNHSFDGIRVVADGITLRDRVVTPNDPERTLRGLEPGRYTVRAQPGDLAFEPEWFELRPGPNEVELRVR